jgi:SipW-cognate class signal peptide
MKKWMKKITSNKRLGLVLTAIILLLVTIGSTYAWWTASATIEQKVTMGNLQIEASFNERNFSNYEPGTTAVFNGTIRNTGTIPALVKIENNSQITFVYSDDDLTPIPLTSQAPEGVDKSLIKISYAPRSGDYEDNERVFWFEHIYSGETYILMERNATLRVEMTITFDGAMTNKYMDAVIEAKMQVKATQVLEGAAQAEFGLDMAHLAYIDNAFSSDDRMTFSLPAKTAGVLRLEELMSRGSE